MSEPQQKRKQRFWLIVAAVVFVLLTARNVYITRLIRCESAEEHLEQGGRTGWPVPEQAELETYLSGQMQMKEPIRVHDYAPESEFDAFPDHLHFELVTERDLSEAMLYYFEPMGTGTRCALAAVFLDTGEIVCDIQRNAR